jgi:hypothetical protein
MKSNVGSIDRIVRIVVGVGPSAWALMGGPVWVRAGYLPKSGVLRFLAGIGNLTMAQPVTGPDASRIERGKMVAW